MFTTHTTHKRSGGRRSPRTLRYAVLQSLLTVCLAALVGWFLYTQTARPVAARQSAPGVNAPGAVWRSAASTAATSNPLGFALTPVTFASFDFQDGTLQGFTPQAVQGTQLWHLANNVCRANLAGHSAPYTLYYGKDATCNFDTGARNAANALSPAISLPGVAASYTLNFNYLLQTETDNSYDLPFVDVSTDGGATWTNVVMKSELTNDNLWHNKTKDISAAVGAATSIRLRFRFDSVDSITNGTTGWQVDDILVIGPACGCPLITLSPAVLPNAAVGVPYSQTLTPSAGTAPFMFSQLSGALPAGLTLTPGGVIQGTTNVTGVFSVTVRVTDANGCGHNQTFSLTVPFKPAPTMRVFDPLNCNGPGDLVTGSFGVTNPTATPQTGTVTVALPGGIVGLGLPYTCTTNIGGTCTVTPGTVTWTGTIPANSALTASYQAQLSDQAAPGTMPCATTTAVFGAFTEMVQACLTVNCPPAGPGALPNAQNQLSDQKPGSVLVYPIFTSEAANSAAQNTRLSVTNTHMTRTAYLHLFFVDGANCNVADGFMCLTPNQTATVLAVDLDPGTTGFLIAVATNRDGCPINFNYLIGDEYVKFTSGHQANLNAESIAAIAGGLPTCDANAVEAQLKFDGLSYNALPRTLAASNLPSRGDSNDTMLIVDRIGGHLGTGAATIGTLIGVLYDDTERPFSFSLAAPTCQSRGSLTNDRPRTTPRLEQVIPAGRTGWLKVYGGTDVGIIGAQINRNPQALTNANAFNQGHNLHKLTLTTTASVTIPVFPPTC